MSPGTVISQVLTMPRAIISSSITRTSITRTPGSRRPLTLLAALLAGLLLAGAGAPAGAEDDISIEVVIPEVVDQPFTVSDAQLRWGLNAETGGGAFFGGCNFLSAGVVGDTGSGRVWTAEDGFYASRDGSVRIERPVAGAGGTGYEEMSFEQRCTGPQGDPVTSSSLAGTGVQAVLGGGRGEVDPASGSATIRWQGGFTVVFYGGLTYWWVTDPVLTVEDGRGRLTGTVGGFGTSMEDMSQWRELAEVQVDLAHLDDVSLRGADGFSSTPRYREVEVDAPDGSPDQQRTGDAWGAFPQSFVDFQGATGQAAYWYSSGGLRDPAKPASPLQVSFDADRPVPPDPGPLDPGPPGGPGSSPGGPGGADGALGGPLAGAGTDGLAPSGPGGPDGPAPGGTAAGRGAAGDAAGPGAGQPAADQLATGQPGAGASGPQTVLPATALIPQAVADALADPRRRLVLAGAGMVLMAGLLAAGLRGGWLVLPWTRT